MPYWRLSGFYFFYFASLGALVPYWGIYLKSIGFSANDIGVFMAIVIGTKIVSPNIWGWIADHLGKRMLIVRIGRGAMSKRVEFLLKEWGQWVNRYLEWPNEWGDNILYRAGFMAGRSGTPGHRILIPECRTSIRRVDTAVRRLTEGQMTAVFCWYCLPRNKETEKPYTSKEIATNLGIELHTFDARLRRGRRNLRKML